MTSKLFASLALAGTAVLGLSASAAAGALSSPGSLLVYPEFDSQRGAKSLITVTNINGDSVNGTIDVEFVYINGDTCLETNRTRRLTPLDTLTIVPAVDNPNYQRGYLYVFAKNKLTGKATSFNYLVGASITLAADDRRDFELQPIVFQAVGADLADTDVDHDGIRDLNGVEYSKAPDQLVFPRFLGQGGNAGVESKLVLINLTGGSQFTAIVDILAYNDNEEVFSAQTTVHCWAKVALSDISGIFNNDFLYNNTNNAVNEVNVGSTGLPSLESGWFSLNGAVASSSATSIADPALLASLQETVDGDGGAQLPFGLGEQDNGDLIPHSIFGDTIN